MPGGIPELELRRTLHRGARAKWSVDGRIAGGEGTFKTRTVGALSAVSASATAQLYLWEMFPYPSAYGLR